VQISSSRRFISCIIQEAVRSFYIPTDLDGESAKAQLWLRGDCTALNVSETTRPPSACMAAAEPLWAHPTQRVRTREARPDNRTALQPLHALQYSVFPSWHIAPQGHTFTVNTADSRCQTTRTRISIRRTAMVSIPQCSNNTRKAIPTRILGQVPNTPKGTATQYTRTRRYQGSQWM
jgi:hypothetical protein